MGARLQLTVDQIDFIMRIPVYPEAKTAKELGKVNISIPVDALVCEDKGRLSFVSAEAKEDFYRKVLGRRDNDKSRSA